LGVVFLGRKARKSELGKLVCDKVERIVYELVLKSLLWRPRMKRKNKKKKGAHGY
jgi:hypothetical protein